jgi:hypothetical protein
MPRLRRLSRVRLGKLQQEFPAEPARPGSTEAFEGHAAEGSVLDGVKIAPMQMDLTSRVGSGVSPAC